MDLTPIPSQTVGPFFYLGCTDRHSCGRLVSDDTPGDRIRLVFHVFDAEGAPVDDAMIEIWQANGEGRYPHPDARGKPHETQFKGFGRMATDAHGMAAFETIRPGRVPDVKVGLQAPHINVSVFARGLLQRLVTRVYFAGAPENTADSVLNLVPAQRRITLFARGNATNPTEWTFPIHLSGEHETVFFDL